MNEISPENIDRLAKIKLFLMDVDGTMTDGRIHYNDEWIESKAFDVTDGFGIYVLQLYSIKTGIITGRKSRIVTERAKELNIQIVRQGRVKKEHTFNEIIAEEGLDSSQVAYIADDLFDLPVLMQVGFSAAPADAHAEVKDRVHFVSDRKGGRGAVRQVCELILKAQGHWEDLMRNFIPDY
ncbi:phenylphosphate carboxylase subunit delta [candidate division LCP-89 bacterium B3_LCP]|uniref:Phenylphosphate carboxylase subunit delta n=1 Tax=candidate division LCP-89 bacterium B3_LCP TaxID=2012998 RepID=A0A532V4H7_UNCL8|nr:MAG: phenylphosphate carboxylase subunit delta [candidate division LCP-89 bacterium B3_LCP]